MKPKEPLFAVLLTFVFPGLGQMYSGKIKRGLVFLGIYAGMCLFGWSIFLYFINPQTRINAIVAIVFAAVALLPSIWGIFIIFDAYKCSKIFNKDNSLARHITLAKRVLLIVGIIIVFWLRPGEALISNYIPKVQTYRIPSGSMRPMLQAGDRLLADKAIYEKSEPQRGDIIVFKYPQDPNRDFVERLIAFGGETLEIREGNIYVDGQLANDPRIKNRFYYNRGDYGQAGSPVKVPEGYYYVLGDDSASSHDSRFWGFVPQENLVGKIYKIYWPLDRSGPVE